MNTPTNKESPIPIFPTFPPLVSSTPSSDQAASSLSPTTYSDSSLLPPHLREHRFRAFEPLLLNFEKRNYQDTTEPCDANPYTAANRCRDAITSVLAYGWHTPLNVESLRKLRGQISIRGNSNGTITIGKSKRGNVAVANKTELLIDCTNDQCLIAIAVLVSQNQIPSTVKIVNQSQDTLTRVLDKFSLAYNAETQVLCLAHPI